MKSKYNLIVLLVFLLAGFMIAVQFQSFQKPKERDTRDTWELRADIQKQQKTQQELYANIQQAEKIINQYQYDSITQTTKTLKNSVQQLKEEAGLTEKKGKGVVFKVEPLFQESMKDVDVQVYPVLTQELLSRLINELNKYGATDISIADERVISITPIRNVNGNIYVNNHPLPPLPFEIKVLAEDPKKLLSYVEYSSIRDYFAIENINLLGKAKDTIVLPKYDQDIHLESIHLLEAEDANGE
ncbi:DUF881 domain-containing protein [Virgibacillus oceani]|uniref:UPF0749 protein YlxX n=1 Tax=Virgibacillus oceani TaxID=1479511 RepID=A0A917M0E7_9BACI|nr:DUF881 domain-containing protein [Virgibacillus oceani]GGG69757.1 UPF0749 protein YlxX [Virgibacillus oceani]